MRDINSLNKVILIGHLGGDPEVRYLPQSERAVARFNIATNERSFNPTTNETKDYTEWHRIVAWGKLAEFCEKYLVRGRQIYIEGKLRTRTWQDRDGNKRFTTEINAQNIVLLGKRELTEEEEIVSPSSAEQQFPPQEDTTSTEGEGEEDDVPF